MSEEPSFPPYPPWPEPAVTGLVDVTDGPIDFTPVPRLRKRRNGWTEQAQRAFIAALEQCGCISRAARAVGMSQRSVYRLLEAEGAASFAEAVDQAIARGVERVRGDAMLRALHGSWVPVVRRGRVVRMEFRWNDKLALGLLSGRRRSVADGRKRALSRHKYKMMLNARRDEENERRRREQAVWAEHQAVLDRIEAERESSPPMSERSPPRVRSL